MKKKFAIAVTVALLTLPLSNSVILAETLNPSTTTTTTSETTTPETTTPETTTSEVTTPDPETTVVTDADGNEVTPSSWLTNFIGQIKLALSYDPVHKCQLSERLALAKLAEAQKLMKEGKLEECQSALSGYSEKITKAQEFIEQVEDSDSEKAKELTTVLTNVNSNNINTLTKLLEKLPPQAAQKLALNVVRSMEKAVTKMEKQEDKVTPADPSETTSGTVSATITPAADSVTNPGISQVAPPALPPAKAHAENNKSLENQAKVALKEFKKSLEKNCNIKLEDAEQHDDEDTVSTSETVTPAQLEQAKVSAQFLEKDKKDPIKQTEQGKEKSWNKNDRDKDGRDKDHR